MKKIGLTLDDLAVETFDVLPADAAGEGTVLAYASQPADTCTCGNSGCPNTCTDMTDCFGLCYPPSGALGCGSGETEYATCYTWHVETCARYYSCWGYPENTCGNTCANGTCVETTCPG